jgi:hypothetical protein
VLDPKGVAAAPVYVCVALTGVLGAGKVELPQEQHVTAPDTDAPGAVVAARIECIDLLLSAPSKSGLAPTHRGGPCRHTTPHGGATQLPAALAGAHWQYARARHRRIPPRAPKPQARVQGFDLNDNDNKVAFGGYSCTITQPAQAMARAGGQGQPL